MSDAWKETIPVLSVEVLGRAISHRRSRLQLSQRALAAKVGVAPSAISRLELEGDDCTPFGIVVRLVMALGMDLELRPRGSKFTPRPPTRLDELGLSPRTAAAVRTHGLERVDQLGSASSMLALPALGNGAEVYEIVCALNRHGLTLPGRHDRVPSDRDREIFRLRIVDGFTLAELAGHYNLNRERIRQILNSFGLTGVPPAASARRKRKRGSI